MITTSDLKFLVLVTIVVMIVLRKLLSVLRACLTSDNKCAFVVVLGDIGRSPRMNYHSLSLVKMGYRVSIIGYKESKQMDEIQSNENINIIPINTFPKLLQVGPQALQYFLKALYLSLALIFTLLSQRVSPKFVLVQNPPSVPTLGAVWLFTKLADTKFIIDWHNYGFTILSLNKSKQNILVKICKKFEIFFGQKSHLNFCVTEAMKNDLLTRHKIRAITLHDKAHERFRELQIKEKHQFYNKLTNQYGLNELMNSKGESIFSEKDQPAILVSSSSWTEDEDFHILLDALSIYQEIIDKNNKKIPDLICMLTGKGPLKEYYQNLFKNKNFKNIKVYFLWLEPDDYPILLGSADLGICLHKSSSDLDLPMKVVDMFGTRLPVCAFKFSCIQELVKENENGLLFTDGKELAHHLIDLLPNMNVEDSKIQKFRFNLKRFTGWNKEWESCMKPEILRL